MEAKLSLYVNVVKPLFDFIIAITAFVLVSPIFIFLVIFLSISNGGNPFFFQLRPGKNEVIFRLIKFRTMNNKKDKNGYLLPDHERLTKIGKFVRKTSLDEIPQLLNIITGKMSLIGPRPLLVEYLPLYSETQKKRHLVKPGITGWAQINGRNTISWQKKFEYDVWYVENIGIILDFKILIRTFLKVLKSDGISSGTSVTMEKFCGNNL